MRRMLPLLAAVVAGLTAHAGRADNPRLSLQLEAVTFADAAQALGRASGQSITLARVMLPPEIPEPAPPAILQERASFNWKDTSFAEALRQLCRRYKLFPNRVAAGYELHAAGEGPQPLPAKLVGLVEKQGLKLFVRGVSVHESSQRRIGFLDAARDEQGQGGMGISLACLLPNRDAAELAGMENLVAKDDLGNVLVADPSGDAFYSGDHAHFGAFPDEWSRSYRFDLPHPKARKLVWLEGDLIGYTRVQAHHLEVPLPLKEEVVRQQAGETTFVVSRPQVIPKPKGDDDELPAPAGVFRRPAQWGPSFRLQTLSPETAQLRSRVGWGVLPVAVGASGKRYLAQTPFGGRGSGGGGIRTSDTTIVFSGMEEPPVKLVWDLVERSQPQKLLSFRMTEIPLPAPARPNLLVPRANPFVPRRTPPAGPKPEPAPAAHPFHQASGGVLVSQVLFPEGPAGPGTLQLGLSRQEASGWTGVRWLNLPLDAKGTARLEDLKPGTYRVLRVYRPDTVPTKARPGRWLNGETQITVAGKETSLPPLRWVTEEGMKTPPTAPKPPAPPSRK